MPSRIMRELLLLSFLFTSIRYTLTYNEGTIRAFCANILNMIHPHIQWGNRFCLKNAAPHRDTPSHTVREPAGGVLHLPPFRYTLTYSEGTCPSQFGKFDSPIHPHIQWGNYFPLSIFNNPCDTPSHTVREPKEMFSRDKMTRYTLTYSEGTPGPTPTWVQPQIHPHIQWGNIYSNLYHAVVDDTPSHTVRERHFF